MHFATFLCLLLGRTFYQHHMTHAQGDSLRLNTDFGELDQINKTMGIWIAYNCHYYYCNLLYQHCYQPSTPMIELQTTESCDDFRKRSGSNASMKKWGKKEAGAQLELRCCINPEILKKNVENHWYFEDETVRVNGSVFSKRENYDNLLSVIPVNKFNGIHIKMEDDCPQGGDDVRLCLLKTLGAHNQREVACVGCHHAMTVYDRYPLCDGVFFLSPILRFGPSIEVLFDGRRYYLQQLCVRCLWADWQCNTCGRDGWFAGKSLMLGTLYYYDVISSGRCCTPCCQLCRSPLLVPESVIMQLVQGNFTLINELVTCSACGSKQHHLARQMDEVRITPPSRVFDQAFT